MALRGKSGSHEVSISPRVEEGGDHMTMQPCDESSENMGPGYSDRMKGSHAYQ